MGEVPPRGESKSTAPSHSKSAAATKPRVKAKSSLSGRNYLITVHHQATINFENFTEVKFRNVLLTGMGHRDRRLNWDSPGHPGTYGRSNLNQNLKPKSSFRFIPDDHLLFLFSPKVPPPLKVPPWGIAPHPAGRGPNCDKVIALTTLILKKFTKCFFSN